MPKHNKVSVYGDNALREFYEACGLAPETIEGALKVRYREPPVTAARETHLAKRLHERRKRNSTAKGTEG
jgi:hypothetical protein